MDDLTRNLRLVDVINASDAANNARTLMEEHAEELLDEEQWEGIVRHVFPLLEAELARLDVEYRRLRGGTRCGALEGCKSPALLTKLGL